MFELSYAGFVLFLLLAGDLVFSVFGEITEFTGGLDALSDVGGQRSVFRAQLAARRRLL
jgi:hypothetical protein